MSERERQRHERSMERFARRHNRRRAKGKSFMFDNMDLDLDFELFPGYVNDGTILVTGVLGLLAVTGAIVQARRGSKAVSKRHCESCSAPLTEFEQIACDQCSIERIEQLLASDAWMQVRGPYMADTMRSELAMLKARKGSRAALGAVERRSMPKSQFAVPQRRTFPIDTRARAIKALSYAKWPNNKRWEPQVRKAVFARWPELVGRYGTAAEKRRTAA